MENYWIIYCSVHYVYTGVGTTIKKGGQIWHPGPDEPAQMDQSVWDAYDGVCQVG
jgi:hypothetical protein